MEAVLPAEPSPGEIRAGLPYSDLTSVMEILSLTNEEAAEILLISTRTLARRRIEGRLTQEESDRLVRVRNLVEDAQNAFAGDLKCAVEWLKAEKTLLVGESPLKHADTEPGRKAVRDMLGVIRFNMVA